MAGGQGRKAGDLAASEAGHGGGCRAEGLLHAAVQPLPCRRRVKGQGRAARDRPEPTVANAVGMKQRPFARNMLECIPRMARMLRQHRSTHAASRRG
eukprot:530156-Rhodomonas_salina.1